MSTTLKNRYLAALSGAGAEASGNGYDAELDAFDPQADFERSARGAYQGFRENLREDVSSLRGEQASMGRLRSGFAGRDEDQLVSRSAERFEGMLADRALQTSGMRLQRLGMQGQRAENASNRYLDLLSGGMDRETAEENDRRDRRRGKRSAIGAVLGGVGGFVAGGPAGASLGASLGGSVGRYF